MMGLQSAELIGSSVLSELANMADHVIESLLHKLLFQKMIANVRSLKDDTVASVDDECL